MGNLDWKGEQWEYTTASFGIAIFTTEGIDMYHTVMTAKGLQVWELVQVIEASGGFTALFKRPKY